MARGQFQGGLALYPTRGSPAGGILLAALGGLRERGGMIRLLAIALALLPLSACKPTGLQTIEEAESFAKERGVVLSEKKEVQGQMVAPRAYGYKANGAVDVAVFQFASDKAATTWKTASEEMPLGRETFVQKGPVVFAIYGATDTERQKVIEVLK